MNTEDKVEKLEDKVDDIKQDTKAITQTLIDMNNKMKLRKITDEKAKQYFTVMLVVWFYNIFACLSSLSAQSVRLDSFQDVKLAILPKIVLQASKCKLESSK